MNMKEYVFPEGRGGKEVLELEGHSNLKSKKERFFLMLLVYYRLYITYTLSGFLFDLDQSNICRDISMLEPLIKLSIAIFIKNVRGTLHPINSLF